MIKFRAWDKEFKIMSGVTRIDYRGEFVELSDGEPYLQDFSKVELMQSTGLFDKGGQEIFEGDIISTYTDNLIIKRDNLLGFYVEVDEKREYFAEIVDIEYLDLFAKDFGVAVKVLGNIYENPELLER